MSRSLTRPFRLILAGLALIIAMSASLAYASTTHEDPAWSYAGTWTTVTGVAGASANNLHWSNTTGSMASIGLCSTTAAPAINFVFYFSKATNRGIARIKIIEGEFGSTVVDTTIDMYVSGLQRQQTASYNIPVSYNGGYIVEIYVTGTKNASATDYFVDIDKIVCN
jgi:hypothetical protein